MNPDDNYYYCSSYKKRQPCSIHNTKTNRLSDRVFTAIKITSEIALRDEQNFIDKISADKENIKKSKITFLSNALDEKQKRISELQKVFKNLYADKIVAKITETQFNQLYEFHNAEFQTLNVDIAEISKKIETIRKNQLNLEKFISAIKSYGSINDESELTVEIPNIFIDKVICHEPIGIGKNRTQRLEIYWNGIGHIDFTLLK